MFPEVRLCASIDAETRAMLPYKKCVLWSML
jgi:hypothetical protein